MRRIIHGVTGSIAAYKAAELTSLLVKAGCDVTVVMTADALRFITALPFKTLSRHPVVTDLYDETEGWKPTHIQLADAADLLLIAPATANTIAKLALGLADDALTCIALALNPEAKLLIAPAMNGKMWLHPATQHNVATLKKRGAQFIGPEKGVSLLRIRGPGPLVAVRANCPPGGAPAAVTSPSSWPSPANKPSKNWPACSSLPPVEPSQRAARIQAVEKDVILPLRVLLIAILGYFFFLSDWSDVPGKPRGIGPCTGLPVYFWFYLAANLAAGAALSGCGK